MGKPHLSGACENPVELRMCDGPIETVEYIWLIFGGCWVGFSYKTAEIHILCIQLIN